jgi:anthranilate phosphoribosyltransferase
MILQNLTISEFQQIFDDILHKKISDSQIIDFLVNLNLADLPLNAFIGAVSSLQQQAKIFNNNYGAIDICGTGGDKLNTLNISTAAAFVVAGAGIKVAKHGNKAISSKSGSANIFWQLNIKIANDENGINQQLQDANLCFLYAPDFHPILANIANIRQQINYPTIFNYLGPLLNPLRVKYQLIGTSNQSTINKILQVIKHQQWHQKAMVVCAKNGMDEISTSEPTHIQYYCNQQILLPEIIQPNYFAKSTIQQIQGKDAVYNARQLMLLLEGKDFNPFYRDIVLINSAYAIDLLKNCGIEYAIYLAAESLTSGRALRCLKKLQQHSENY